jgi:hypothetical protein
MICSLLLTVSLLGQLAGDAPPPLPPQHPTLLVVVKGDALTLAVVTAAEKPYPFRQLPLRGEATHQFRFVDAKGKTLATVPVDFSTVCLDPLHVGMPPHGGTDTVTPHDVVRIVSLPLVKASSDLLLERLGPVVNKQPTTTLVGVLARNQLNTLLAKSRNSRMGR